MNHIRESCLDDLIAVESSSTRRRSERGDATSGWRRAPCNMAVLRQKEPLSNSEPVQVSVYA